MEYYCPPCETAMCQECTSGEHGEHPTVPLKDVVEQHKASLQDQLDAVKKRYSSNTNGTEQDTVFLLPTAKGKNPVRTHSSLFSVSLCSLRCLQVARDRLSPADAVRDPAAADQSKECDRGRHTHDFR